MVTVTDLAVILRRLDQSQIDDQIIYIYIYITRIKILIIKYYISKTMILRSANYSIKSLQIC